MAKELPYFRFTPSEWQNGNISLEDYEIQGFFVQVCCYYWICDCSITKSMLEKRFKYDTEIIKKCIEIGVCNYDKKSDAIQINFLNEQFDVLSTSRKNRQLAGSLGGKQRSSNAIAKLKQNPSYKDKDNNKDNDNIKQSIFSFSDFWNVYPNKSGKQAATSKYEKLSENDRELIKTTIESFINNKPFKDYNHPMATTYINQKRWLDFEHVETIVLKPNFVQTGGAIEFSKINRR